MKLKIGGVTMMSVLLGIFILKTSAGYKALTGTSQFSPFSGWQLANNAMCAYKMVDSIERKEMPARFRLLDRDVRRYIDTTRDVFKHPQEMLVLSTYYMWKDASPFQIYMNRGTKKDSMTTSESFVIWAKVGPLYKDYGASLIKKYPIHFTKYYLWPNLIRYYAPPIEFLEKYNSGEDTVAQVAKVWFGFKSNKVYTRTKDFNVRILALYPVFNGMMNAVYIMVSISFFVLGGIKRNKMLFVIWSLFTLYWLLNVFFSVFASPIAIRFQLLPLILCTVFNFVYLDFIIKSANKEECQ